MKSKMKIIPNSFILDEISLDEIQLAWEENMKRFERREQSPVFDEEGFKTLFMNFNDAVCLANKISSTQVILVYKGVASKLEIKQFDMPKNEINFS